VKKNAVMEAVSAGAIAPSKQTYPDKLDEVLLASENPDLTLRLYYALEVVEGIEAWRKSLPWWKRWTYCIGSLIRDIREVL